MVDFLIFMSVVMFVLFIAGVVEKILRRIGLKPPKPDDYEDWCIK